MATASERVAGNGKQKNVFNKLSEMIAQLADFYLDYVRSLTAGVNDLKKSYEDAKSKKTEIPKEARVLCQEFVQLLVHGDAYMEKVDNFVWHTKRTPRQKKVLEALGQETPQTRPLEEYFSQLALSLGQADEGHATFIKYYEEVIERLDKVLSNCKSNLKEAEQKLEAQGRVKTVAKVTSGIGVGLGGVMMVGGTIMAVCAAIPTLGFGALIGLAVAGSGMAVAGAGAATVGAVSGAAYLAAKKFNYEVLIEIISTFKKRVESIGAVAKSIDCVISEVNSKLIIIQNLKDTAESQYNMPDSQIESVELLFHRFVTFGDTFSSCYQELKSTKETMKTLVNELLLSSTTDQVKANP